MKKYKLVDILLITALIVNITSVAFLHARAGTDADTISYLQSQAPDVWNTMGPSAAGQTPGNLDHLKSVSGTKATDYARTILGITATGNDPRTFGSEDLITKLKTFYDGAQIGSTSTLNEDMWAVLALISAGESSTSEIIQNTKNFIAQNQNGDGGWSYAVGSASDTNDTAVAIMALMSADVTTSDARISSAQNYLRASQNDDGGFPFSAGGESDGGSDAWVLSAIYRLGQSPSDWTKNNANPLSHLQTLKTSDGSYKWMAGDASGFGIITAYSAVALSNKWYPVRSISYTPPNNDQGNNNGNNTPSGSVNFRIEGSQKQICKGSVNTTNALQLIKDAAAQCGYSYTIEDTAWGPYLSAINTDASQGLYGWMYLVNNESPLVGAADYALNVGDTVLWFFDAWAEDGNKQSRMTLSKDKVEPNESFGISVEFYENSSWKPVPSGTITIDSQNFTVTNGSAAIALANKGIFPFTFDGEKYIRSDEATIKVGADASQEVDVKVNVLDGGSIFVPQIAFAVSDDVLDFASIKPGQNSTKNITVQNIGNVNIKVAANVSGDPLFTTAGNLTLNMKNWNEFGVSVGKDQSQVVASQLNIPSGYSGIGVKNGKIIFWAVQE